MKARALPSAAMASRCAVSMVSSARRSTCTPRGDDSNAVWTTASADINRGRYIFGSPSSAMTGVAPLASNFSAFSGSRAMAVTRWPPLIIASSTADPMYPVAPVKNMCINSPI